MAVPGALEPSYSGGPDFKILLRFAGWFGLLNLFSQASLAQAVGGGPLLETLGIALQPVGTGILKIPGYFPSTSLAMVASCMFEVPS